MNDLLRRATEKQKGQVRWRAFTINMAPLTGFRALSHTASSIGVHPWLRALDFGSGYEGYDFGIWAWEKLP